MDITPFNFASNQRVTCIQKLPCSNLDRNTNCPEHNRISLHTFKPILRENVQTEMPALPVFEQSYRSCLLYHVAEYGSCHESFMVYESCIRWELKVIGDSSVRETGSTAQMKRTLNSWRNVGLL